MPITRELRQAVKDSNPYKNIVVVGGPRTGKTLNAKAIAKAFGCEEIIDGYTGTPFDLHHVAYYPHKPLYRNQPAEQPSLLILTNAAPTITVGVVITIEFAREACGSEWIEPEAN